MVYISTGMVDRFSALLMSLIALRLMLVHQNPFQPCLKWISLVTFCHWICTTDLSICTESNLIIERFYSKIFATHAFGRVQDGLNINGEIRII